MTPPQMGAGEGDTHAWSKAKRLGQWLEQLLGPAKPLDEVTRRQMEAFLGYSLEDVRIHDSRQAAEIARRLGAEAFVIGSQIFAAGEGLNPLTPQGMGLLAHELTHVIQHTRPHRLPQSSPAASRPVPVGEQGIPQEGVTAQLAGGSPRSLTPVERDMEAEAQANEQAMRSAAESGDQGVATSPEIDVEGLADRVYRLMQQDLVLERERKVGAK